MSRLAKYHVGEKVWFTDYDSVYIANTEVYYGKIVDCRVNHDGCYYTFENGLTVKEENVFKDPYVMVRTVLSKMAEQTKLESPLEIFKERWMFKMLSEGKL